MKQTELTQQDIDRLSVRETPDALPELQPSRADEPPLVPGRPSPELTAENLGNIYTLFLGRTAPARPEDLLGLDFAGLLAAIFASDEFRFEVLTKVMLREELPEERFPGEPPYRLIDWAQQQLPIEAGTVVACGLARTWSALLEVLLADPGVARFAPEFLEAGVTAILRDRIARDPTFSVGRAIVGAIDAASAYEVRGWAADLCDKSQPVTLEFFADGVFIGAARCDQPRSDVADELGGNGLVGFTFRIAAAHRAAFAPGCVLTANDSILRQPVGPPTTVHAEAAEPWDAIVSARREIAQMRETLKRLEAQIPELHRMASLPLEAYTDYWERFYRPTPDVLASQRGEGAMFAYRPLVSIVVPAYKSNALLLEKLVLSVLRQTYSSWELIITDDATPDPSDLEIVRRRHGNEERIRWIAAERRGGIAKNTNRGIAAAKGDYVAFLDHDDELAPDALHCTVARLQESRFALLYSDEDRIEEDEFGRCIHHTPFFKPDFDSDLLFAMNYICHLVVVRRDVLRGVGGLRAGIDGAQDHDLLLRLAARLSATDILHIPRVLYHWRVTPGSVSESPQNVETLRRAIVAVVDAHLRQAGHDALVESHTDPIGRERLYANRIRWNLPERAPKVSIIIPTRDRLDLLEPCVESILQASPVYPGELELLIVDNESVERSTAAYLKRIASRPGIRILRHEGHFNWSAINNAAAREAKGEILIFLNNDTRILTPEWCNELVANALRPDVGAVGARLLFHDGTIQHAGVLLGVEGVAGHEGLGESPSDGGYFGRSHLIRSTSAVTGACLATRRQLFLELGGGFDELHLKVAFNDVDFCMRVRQAGLRIIYNPFAVVYHFESKSRGRDFTAEQQARHRSEARAFQARWRDLAAVDPYFNPHFERFARPFERLRPPPES